MCLRKGNRKYGGLVLGIYIILFNQTTLQDLERIIGSDYKERNLTRSNGPGLGFLFTGFRFVKFCILNRF